MYNEDDHDPQNIMKSNLNQLKLGEIAVICGIMVNCDNTIRQRLLDLGFVKGAEVSVQNISPLGDPVAYCVHETLIALRKEDALFVQIIKDKEHDDVE